MNASQKGDHAYTGKQFDLFFHETYPRVLRYLEKISGQREVAEDIAQNIYLQLWENKNTLPSAQNERLYYLFAIARNSFYQHTRKMLKEQQHLSSFSDIHLDDTSPSPEEAAAAARMEGLIVETLAGLEPLKTKFFLLNRENGLSYREIAEREGVSVKTVMRYIGSVTKTLRSRITSFFW